jgi:hypothetical protein
MSAPSSRALPISGRGSTEDSAQFDGAGALIRSWRNGMRPDPELTVSQWADRHRRLGSRASAEPGQYRTSRTPYMREIMDRLSPGDPTQRIVFMKAAQVGAPLALDTAIPTPFGWTTMGAIAEGDLLYDEGGRIVRVTGLSPVFPDRTCYAVVFDDGERIVTDGDHRWAVRDFTNGKPVARTSTTAEMAGRVTIGTAGKRHRFAVDCCDPVDMPEQDLILHPYVLGLWLGDGSAAMNHISVHEEDAEIVAHLRASGVEAEFRLPRWRKGYVANVVIDPTFRMRRDDGASLSDCFRSRFVTRLRQLDVLDNKHARRAPAHPARRTDRGRDGQPLHGRDHELDESAARGDPCGRGGRLGRLSRRGLRTGLHRDAARPPAPRQRRRRR